MKAKWIFLLLIVVGIGLSGVAIFQMVSSKIESKNALEEAKALVEEAAAAENGDNSSSVTQPADGVIGLLTLPKINSELAIVKGTDPDDLEKGVGHYEGSFFPDQNGQIVLSGHRDTVFQRVGELAIGDEMTISLASGSYTYAVESTKIVEADDTSIITLQNEREELILTTCYPFGYVGNAPQRYIIYAKRVV